MFAITQHSRDEELMNLFIKFFNCGKVYTRKNPRTPRCDFIVQAARPVIDKLIPHFDKYPLLAVKQKYYICFKKAMTIIDLKDH